MVRRTVRVAVCGAALAAVCGAARGQSVPRGAALGRKISALVAQPAVVRAHWGVMVTALDGTPIYGMNEGQMFQPASNAKLFTTAAAMALLGEETRYETAVVMRGGDVVIKGGGDANLSGRMLPYLSPKERAKLQPGEAAAAAAPLRYLEDLADRVAATGVKVISGDVVGDDTLFPWEPYPSDWSIDDMVWGYGAPVSALSVNDNQVQVTVAPGPWPGGAMTPAVTVVPAVPYYTLDVHVAGTAAKSASSVEMERAPGGRVLRIYGTMATDAQPDVEEVAIEDPAEYAAVAFKGMLEARGITVRGVARAEHAEVRYGNYLPSNVQVSWDILTGAVSPLPCPMETHVEEEPVATHRGPTVKDDVILTNKVSENLHAELLLHHLGKLVFCGLGSTRAGLAVVRAFLLHAGLDKDDFVFFDGSGLSGHDLVTPRAVAKLLRYAAMDPETGAGQTWFADWKASLPVGGEDGSLASRFAAAPLKDRVFAKTGTLGEARALSGYLECKSGRTVIFSVMVGNHAPGSNADRDAMDKIVGTIWAAE